MYVGTSGWAYAAWKPDFYPGKLAPKKFLEYYATQLNAVEVNYSFRRRLTEKLLQGWIAQTPPGFRFCLKAYQGITHFRRLKNAGEWTQSFFASLQPLHEAGKLGVVLFQLPPDFKADAEVLAAFLAELPRHARCAFEFRHDSWFSDQVYALLRKHKVALCVAESDELQTPEVVTASFLYYRFRRSDYSAARKKKLAAHLAEVARRTETYAFFKHEERPESALNAVDVLRAAQRKAA